MRKVSGTLLVILLLSGCSTVPQSQENHDNTIKIASFNIQVFGQVKAGKPEVMDILAQIIRQYDIVAIQEIRDATKTAIVDLWEKVNENGRSYAMIVGPSVGRTSSKEQYAYIFDEDTFDFPETYMYDDDGDRNGVNDLDDSIHPNDLFEREPFVAYFKVRRRKFDFVLINIHTKPDDANAEIGYLPDVIDDATRCFDEPDVICLGDFNADGRYFDEATYTTIFPANEYLWLVPNSADTTVSASDNTYDRIVTTISTAEDYTDRWGVFRFNQTNDLSLPTLDATDVSDHYPV